MDEDSTHRDACAQDHLPRLVNPLLLMVLYLQRIIPAPAFGDVRPERIALHLEREFEIVSRRWTKRELHEA